MLYLSRYCVSYLPCFNVFHYVSVRAIASLLGAFAISLLFGGWFINKSKIAFRSKVREWVPDTHQGKANMPTMGGIFILAVVVLNSLIWANLTIPQVWIFLLCLVGFGAIGAWDDWHKIKYDTGISAKAKFGLQLLVSFIVSLLLIYGTTFQTTLIFPFFKHLQPNIGLFYVPWVMFILVGCSNGVNLTDGLDGLAIGSLMSNFATFSVIAYMAGHVILAQYLRIPFAGSAEIAVLGATLFGASLGFLWFNTYPAQIFMGDVGSLALGAGLALMAIMAKQELLLPISGGLFVIETVSVIAQVLSLKLFGKRMFKMAPIHHHFELLGWQESKITVRFGIISFILSLLALITLKLR